MQVKLTRKIIYGHLAYSLEGDFEPFPFGSLAKQRLLEYFTSKTKTESHPKANEGYFFRYLLKDDDPITHARLYRKYFCDSHGFIKDGSPNKEIGFIVLKPLDLLFYNLKEKGKDLMIQEYQEILSLLEKTPNDEQVIEVNF